MISDTTKAALIIVIALSLCSCSWIADKVTGSASKGLSVKANIAKDIQDENNTLKNEAEILKQELALFKLGDKKDIAGDDKSSTINNAMTWYNSLYFYMFLALLFLIIMWGYYKAKNTSTQYDKDMIDKLLKMVLDKK